MADRLHHLTGKEVSAKGKVILEINIKTKGEIMLSEFTVEITIRVVADCEESAYEEARSSIGDGEGTADITRVTPRRGRDNE